MLSRLTLATATANVAAGALVAAAFVSVRNEAVLARQVGGLELAGLAGVVAIAADLAWIVAGYRAVVAHRRRLSRIAGTNPARRPASGGAPVALPTGTLLHHPTCALVEGKAVEALAPEVLAGRGLRPCPVCTP